MVRRESVEVSRLCNYHKTCGKEKVMNGEPMVTIAAATESLKHEIMQRQQDVNAALNALQSFK